MKSSKSCHTKESVTDEGITKVSRHHHYTWHGGTQGYNRNGSDSVFETNTATDVGGNVTDNGGHKTNAQN